MEKKIIVFGGTNMDILGFPRDHLTLRDSNIGSIRLQPGGVGRNVAQHIAERGYACTLLTAFGNDALADALCASCARAGVDISHAMVTQGSSCVYLCLHDETGDMLAAVNDMSLTEQLTPAYAASQLERINGADLCVLDGNPPVETVRFIAENAAVPLLMDPVSCAKLDRAEAALPFLHAIKPNLMEARELTGEKDAGECARALIRKGVKRVFISLGRDGLCCADGDLCAVLPVERYSAAPKTGAGDALCAGLAIALANGCGTMECAKYGMQCAADYLNAEEVQAK